MATTDPIYAWPAGVAGLRGSSNPYLVPPEALIEAEGVVLWDGPIRTEPGAFLLEQPSVGHKVQGLCDYWPTVTQQRLITYANGTLYRDGVATTNGTALNTANQGSFTLGGSETLASGRKLFFANGANQLRYLDGDVTTWTVFAALIPPEWTSGPPVGVCVYQGRVCAWAGPWLWLSDPGNHLDFTGTNAEFMPIALGASNRILAGVPYKGLLFLFGNPLGVWFVDARDPDSTNWTSEQVATSVGVASVNGAASIADNVLFVAADGGIHILSATQDFGNVHDHDVTAALDLYPWLRANTDLSKLNEVCVAWYGHRRTAMVVYPRAGSGRVTLYLDFNRYEPGDLRTIRVTYSFRDATTAIAARVSQTYGADNRTDKLIRPIWGEEDGKVWSGDRDTRLKGSTGYVNRYKTPHIDLSRESPRLATQNKNIEFIELLANGASTWTSKVSVLLDDVVTTQTNMQFGNATAALGTFIVGTSSLASDQAMSSRKRAVGQGRRISLLVENPEDGSDVSILQHLITFVPSDEARRGP